ncbi:hypothetical protein, partial [Holdemania filiformis]|uniref:hypothetical protein n=1 Tax=Holdemania filiformis TaxID=61171 RepID=UPI00266F72BC
AYLANSGTFLFFLVAYRLKLSEIIYILTELFERKISFIFFFLLSTLTVFPPDVFTSSTPSSYPSALHWQQLIFFCFGLLNCKLMEISWHKH